MIAKNSSQIIAENLLQWYDANARVLPWRSRPGADRMDVYKVWLSEVMLQQTTVAAVIPYFAEFTRRWPTVDALAGADEADVMAAWAGLGYYARARNMVKCAREVAARGAWPRDEAGLRSLPGLGAYTAAAIAAIAYGQRAVVVDANIERVAARLFAIETELPKGKPEVYAAADRITPNARAGDFAQALMDLGASLCTARRALCTECPLAENCAAHAKGEPLSYPKKAAKKPRPTRCGKAFWIAREGAGGDEVYLVTRGNAGMLAGMRALPCDGWSAGKDGSGAPPFKAEWQALGLVSHGFTHFQLELSLVAANYDGSSALPDGEWWPLAALDEAGLPTLFAKAAQLALALK